MGRSLLLYRVQETPPPLVVAEASPEHRVERDLGGLVLLGFDLSDDRVEAGGTLHLTLYWQVEQPGRYGVATTLGEGSFPEVHELGFGNLERYQRELGPVPDGIVVEEYDLVVLSSTPAGRQTLRVGLAAFPPVEGAAEELVDLAEVLVVD